MSATFMMLPVDDIVFDSKQPRKFFDELAMRELTESVKEIGILQPIIVRPGVSIGTGHKQPQRPGYMVISGERRLRAAYAAELTEVPVVIREGLSDQEILEIQITENLQRKDVNPMEEGIAFEQLKRTYTIEEIAHRVGKSAQYVAQRISLTNLTDGWQQIMFDGKITLTQAYKLARISPEVQNEAYKEAIDKDGDVREYSLDSMIDLEDHNLDSATFQTEDEDLYPEAGPCGSCRYNSANDNLLFPDLNKKRICHNSACWTIKSSRAYKVTLEEIVSDPNMVFVHACYSPDKEEKAKIKAAEELGVKVLGHGDYEILKEPTAVGTLEEYLAEQKKEFDWDEMDAEEQKEALRDWKDEYASEKEDYEEEKAEYDRDIQDAVKAFVVAGDSWNGKEGSIVYIKPKKGKSSQIAAAQAKGNPELEQVREEIARIKEKQSRNVELDREKIQANVNGLFNEEFMDDETPLSEVEENALICAMCEKSYKARHYVTELMGKVFSNSENLYDAVKKSRGILTLGNVSRVFIVDMINSNLLDPKRWAHAAAILDVATTRWPRAVGEFTLEQKNKANKRDTNLKSRLDALIAKKEALEVEVIREQNIENGKKAQAKAKKK
jgi:ParB family transcriptional regulator, chromosome partitioning protein